MHPPLMQAKKIVDEIYKMTKATVLTGARDLEETETEQYESLINNREPLIEELMALKAGIDTEMASSAEFKQIKQTIAEIRQLDEKLLDCVKLMQLDVQDLHKGIKQGQNVYAGYQSFNAETGRHILDIKQ